MWTDIFSLSLCRPFLDMVYSALDCTSDDYHALFVLCLLYAVSHSKGLPFFKHIFIHLVGYGDSF